MNYGVTVLNIHIYMQLLLYKQIHFIILHSLIYKIEHNQSCLKNLLH